MGLTATKLKDLKAKQFDQLLDQHHTKWMKMAQVASDFAKDNICKGNDPNADDILKALLITLEPDDVLRKYQEENRCKFKMYREAFGDYIVDTFRNGGTPA